MAVKKFKPRTYRINRLWLPLTYIPKIDGVLAGDIRQTIREGWHHRPGQIIRFHGWQGTPYRSPWSFRTDEFPLIDVINLTVFEDGIEFHIPGCPGDGLISPWEKLGWLAALDGILPPTGEELKRVLTSFRKIPSEGLKMQALRW